MCTNLLFIHLSVVFVSATVAASPPRFNHGVNWPTDRPLNIGHRGSSGTYPEHTAEAYRQAIRDGADAIECDVTVTKDLRLVCLHDPWLSSATDVAERAAFGDRRQTYYEESIGNKTDWFAFDFTLEELQTLKVKQRFDFRDHSHDGQYSIPTLEEYIGIAKGAGRPVGIYPEVKMPEFINMLPILQGQRFEDKVLEVLDQGYSAEDDLCLIQSFSEDSIRYMANKTQLPLVMLLSQPVSDAKLQELGHFAYGVGCAKRLVNPYETAENGYKNYLANATGFVEAAHQANLKVHIYTFRNEDVYLAWDFRQDPALEYDYFLTQGIDGFFTDFPATFDRFLDETYREAGCSTGSADTCQPASTIIIGALFLVLIKMRRASVAKW